MEQLSRFLNSRTRMAGWNCVRLLVIFLLVNLGMSRALSQTSGSPSFTVVLDAGHGGKDPGAVGKKSYEKNLALAIVKKLGSYIEDQMPDVKVIYTRKTDVFIDLDVRASIANKANADLFLSVHVDGIGTPNAYGTSTYVMGVTKNETNLALAKKENKVIEFEKDYSEKYSGFDTDSPLNEIILRAVQKAYENQSLDMASRVQDQFRTRANRKDRGVHPAPFLVLWQTTMPSVLIETGFITNPKEEEFLNSSYGQDLMASAIFRAFKEYKEGTIARTISEGSLLADDQPSVKTPAVSSPTQDSSTKEAILSKETVNDTKYVAPKTKTSTLVFKVQVLASGTPIPASSKVFKGHTGFQEIKEGGFYKYVTPGKSSYSEALAERKNLLNSFPGAFIIALKDGIKIPLPQAIEEDKKNH